MRQFFLKCRRSSFGTSERKEIKTNKENDMAEKQNELVFSQSVSRLILRLEAGVVREENNLANKRQELDAARRMSKEDVKK